MAEITTSAYSAGTRMKKYEGAYTAKKFEQTRSVPAFYIIKPTLCKELHLIKIGKTHDLKGRMSNYAHHYDARFNLIYCLVFRKVRDGEQIGGSTDFSSKFERILLEKLKDNNIRQIHGYEFFQEDDLPRILQLVEDVRNEQEVNIGVNRKSKRKYFIEKIIDKKTENGRVHYLVQWKGYRVPTWEPYATLKEDAADLLKAFNKR